MTVCFIVFVRRKLKSVESVESDVKERSGSSVSSDDWRVDIIVNDEWD